MSRTMTMPCRPKIAMVSDTAAGLGSPQIEQLLRELVRHYPGATGLLLEPDTKGKAPLSASPDAKIDYVRIATRFPPYYYTFHLEYARASARHLAAFDPDVVVITSATAIPPLLMLPRRPRFVIYYMLESLNFQVSIGGQEFLNLHQMVKDRIDLICVPELARAKFDVDWLGWSGIPTVELYNVSADQFSPPPLREALRFINAGSISAQTHSHYFGNDALGRFPVDLFGIVDNEDLRNRMTELSARAQGVRYRGVLPMTALDVILGRYAYSIVMWSPSNVNQIHASPNKLFQAISKGVPPISAPHPQCVDIVRRYDCGILLRDWTIGALVDGLTEASAIYGTERYAELVSNCELATQRELNWPLQFTKVAALLPKASKVEAA